MMTTTMGGKNLFKSLALEDGESAWRLERQRRRTAASMNRSAGKRKFMQMNVGSVVPKSNRSAGSGRGRREKPSKPETLHQHPAALRLTVAERRGEHGHLVAGGRLRGAVGAGVSGAAVGCWAHRSRGDEVDVWLRVATIEEGARKINNGEAGGEGGPKIVGI